jgi:subfamily B ATP-binding cassette protein MsbA
MPAFRERITFDHISFAYQSTTVLDQIQFTLEKGKKIALVGQSGSGKSTIAKLLVRFYDPSAGNIIVDGVPLHDLSAEDWLQHLGYISQETFLLNDSVRNNLLMGNPNATEEAMWNALEVAHAVDFVKGLPGGLEASLGESGGKLSGGQRQRIGIARAVLKDPAILVLDEATSALDSESERTVQQALDALMAERTTLIIAHRLSTIQQADEILVLKEGTHTGLLALQGYYADLWRLQR